MAAVCIAEGVTTGPVDPVGRDNGVLASVSGQRIAGGSKSLPPPESMPRQTTSVLIDGGCVGRARITYVSWGVKHRKHSHWAWRAERADREPQP
jgi:hypothetical protein